MKIGVSDIVCASRLHPVPENERKGQKAYLIKCLIEQLLLYLASKKALDKSIESFNDGTCVQKLDAFELIAQFTLSYYG